MRYLVIWLFLMITSVFTGCRGWQGSADAEKGSSIKPQDASREPNLYELIKTKEDVQISSTKETLNKIYFINPKTGWAVGENGVILHTGDGGQSWDKQESGTKYNLTDVSFISSEKGFAIGNAPGSSTSKSIVLFTENGGSKWEEKKIDTEGSFSGLHFVDSINGWLYGSMAKRRSDNYLAEFGVIAISQNAGESWDVSYIPSGPVDKDGPVTKISFINPKTGWAVGASSIRKTTDGGKTWEIQYKKPYNFTSNYGFLNVKFIDDKTGWAFGSTDGETGSYTGILHTKDGGKTWEENLIEFPLYDIEFFTPNLGIGVGVAAPVEYKKDFNSPPQRDGIVAITKDGGKTWEIQKRISKTPIKNIFFLPSNEGWAVGENGTIIHWQP
jgi:photosystem II stability/assembly factor-like uncharacterized protein